MPPHKQVSFPSFLGSWQLTVTSFLSVLSLLTSNVCAEVHCYGDIASFCTFGEAVGDVPDKGECSLSVTSPPICYMC